MVNIRMMGNGKMETLMGVSKNRGKTTKMDGNPKVSTRQIKGFHFVGVGAWRQNGLTTPQMVPSGKRSHSWLE